MFYPLVMYLLTVRITEAFDLPKPSLFLNYKVMLLLCHLRVKLNSTDITARKQSCGKVMFSQGACLSTGPHPETWTWDTTG